MIIDIAKKIARKIGLGKYVEAALKKINYTRKVNVYGGGGRAFRQFMESNAASPSLG